MVLTWCEDPSPIISNANGSFLMFFIFLNFILTDLEMYLDNQINLSSMWKVY